MWEVLVIYNDKSSEIDKKHNSYIKEIDYHISNLEECRSSLLSFIIHKIPIILERENSLLIYDEYESCVEETHNLLSAIHDEFCERKQPNDTFSYDEAQSYIILLSSSKEISEVAETLFSLFSIEDAYIKEQFFSIVRHLLENSGTPKPCSTTIDNSAHHLVDHGISDEIAIDFFDFFYSLANVSDIDQDIVNWLIHGAITNHPEFKRIHDMLLAYNPFYLDQKKKRGS